MMTLNIKGKKNRFETYWSLRYWYMYIKLKLMQELIPLASKGEITGLDSSVLFPSVFGGCPNKLFPPKLVISEPNLKA